MSRFTLSILLTLFMYLFSYAEKGTYKAYVYFIPVGEIYFDIQKDKAIVKGETYKSLRWIYNYTFRFEANKNGYFLYEKENEKEKVYKNEQIEKKKPWLPLIVKFILEGKKPDSEKDKNFPYRIEEKENSVIIYPLKSKKVKKITVKLSKKDRLPDYIQIDGKIDIKLERIR
ncbi:hypothetical protein SAMN06265182_1429 [Persephonella hydrogeniphila]|uniref:DUF3108 domain-containing protein n=1 Tax=Persephonella hydrogeniphila TaxID=198703 RepID=A0A285NHJ8_9AQUI|nr:hypothetical protein [Persephonella hydrogeniphila]SNZ08950.1 hypothetical protein SAMN06265182_1429 [Persephonella hydrogeniphila]